MFDGSYVPPARQLPAGPAPISYSEYMDWLRKVVLRMHGVSEEMLGVRLTAPLKSDIRSAHRLQKGPSHE